MEKWTEKPSDTQPHDLILEGRSKLTVTGVRRVIRCEPDGAAIETSRTDLATLHTP